MFPSKNRIDKILRDKVRILGLDVVPTPANRLGLVYCVPSLPRIINNIQLKYF